MSFESKTGAWHVLLGQRIKHYQVEQLLGKGGMGVVYRARDLRLDRGVALKFLPSGLTEDAERRKRFQLEARAAARINHPAVAQIYDVDEHEGALFIAMELVEGKTLRELIRNKELDLLGAIDLAVQVSGGLAKAHEMGIVHRDIKPGNVMVTSDGHAKILDFGLAKLLQADPSPETPADHTTLTQTRSGLIKGTPAYMSPEQVKGEPVDARSDVFSLGVLLFESVAGRNPFQRGAFWETMQSVAFDDTPATAGTEIGLAPGLERIIQRCLQKNPENRYPNGRALLQDLKTLRREIELGKHGTVSIKERFSELLDQLAHLSRSQILWGALAFLALGGIIYLLVTDASLGGIVLWAFVILILFRRFRNEPYRLQERFVRRISKLPEVRLIACQDKGFTVVVDSPTGQLYSRINSQLYECNRKLTFGKPFTVAVRHDLSERDFREFLNQSGVQYLKGSPRKSETGAL